MSPYMNIWRHLPNEERLKKLYDDDESQRDENDSEVEQQHEAAEAFSVGTKRVWSAHRLDHQPSLPVDFGFDCRPGGGGGGSAPIRVVTWCSGTSTGNTI